MGWLIHMLTAKGVRSIRLKQWSFIDDGLLFKHSHLIDIGLLFLLNAL